MLPGLRRSEIFIGTSGFEEGVVKITEATRENCNQSSSYGKARPI